MTGTASQAAPTHRPTAAAASIPLDRPLAPIDPFHGRDPAGRVPFDCRSPGSPQLRRHRNGAQRSLAGLLGLLAITAGGACEQATYRRGRDPERSPESIQPAVAPGAVPSVDSNGPSPAVPNLARFQIAAGDIAFEAGRLEEAKHRYESALSLARDTSADAEEILARNQLGVLAERLGALEDARDHYLRALELQQVAPEAVPEARLRANLGGVFTRLRDFTAAEQHFTAATAALDVSHDPASAGAVYRGLGRLRLATEQRAEAISALRLAASLFERAGRADEVAATRLECGIALLAAGDARGAIGELSRALQGFETAMALGRDEARAELDALVALADAYEQIEQPKYGLTFLERAVERARSGADRDRRAALLERAMAAARAVGRDALAAEYERERASLAPANAPAASH